MDDCIPHPHVALLGPGVSQQESSLMCLHLVQQWALLPAPSSTVATAAQLITPYSKDLVIVLNIGEPFHTTVFTVSFVDLLDILVKSE